MLVTESEIVNDAAVIPAGYVSIVLPSLEYRTPSMLE
jgi:hypothetical protein